MTATDAAATSIGPRWRPDSAVDSARILLVGDTGFGLNYDHAHGLKTDDLHDAPFTRLRGLLDSSDLVVANLETVLTDRRDSPLEGKRPYLHYDDPTLSTTHLRKHGIAAVTFANNHVMDMGEAGFLDTLNTLEDNDILYAGAGRDRARADEPLRISIPFSDGTHRGVTVFAGLRASEEFDELTGSFATADSPGCNPLETDAVTARIEEVRKQSPDELIIVVPHWRRDYKWASNAQRSFASSVTAAGADLVIGHGSHMAQEIDILNGRPLLHGIGNFVFNSNGRYSKAGVPPISIVVGLDLSADTTGLRLYPIHTNNRTNGFRGHPVTDEEFAEFYRTALLRTKDSAAFLKAAEPGRDDLGHYLGIDLNRRHRARVNRHHSGRGTGLTVWEEQPETIRFDRSLNSTTIMLERELAKRGASVERLGTNFLIGESAEGMSFAALSTSTNHTGVPGANAAKRKNVARSLLSRAGVRVAEGEFFRSKNDFDEAVTFMERWGSVVVKPVDGNTGRGVTVGVTDIEGMRKAWAFAFTQTSTGVLVEEQFRGEDIRISVVDGVAYAATKRVPPYVTGDGTSTIRELINAKNDERYQNIHLHGKPITLTAFRLDRLEREGLTPLSVLPAGQTYVIDHKGNLATGAEPVDLTDAVHPSYLRAAERAALAFHSVDIAGVDFLGSDFSQPATTDNHIVVEMNTMPDIGGHGSAFEGTPRNVVGPAADSLLSSPRIGPFRPRTRRPEHPDSPTSARLLAVEFAARDMDIDWITGAFFLATDDDSTHSVWGSRTGRTGQVAQLSIRRQAHAQALLRRVGIPTAEGKVYTVGEEAAARKFAAGLGATTLRASDRALVDADGTDSASFTAGWSQLEEAGRRYGICVSRRHRGTRLRLLVAHGRVLTALTTGDAESTDELPQAHSSIRALAAAAVAAFPGLDIGEVTLTAKHTSRSAVQGDVVVDQVLSGPDLVTHHTAAAARGQDIIRTIVDLHLGDESTAPEQDFAPSEPAPHLSDHVRSAAEQTTQRTRGLVRNLKRRLT